MADIVSTVDVSHSQSHLTQNLFSFVKNSQRWENVGDGMSTSQESLQPTELQEGTLIQTPPSGSVQERARDRCLWSPTEVPCNTPEMTPSASLDRQSAAVMEWNNLSMTILASCSCSSKSSQSTSEGDFSSALSSFDMSLVSDNSEDDLSNPGALEVSSSYPRLIPQRSQNLSPERNVGLGISGLTKMNGRGVFDGLGIVSVESLSWRHVSEDRNDSFQGFAQEYLSTSLSSCNLVSQRPSSPTRDPGRELSGTFLHEALLAFQEDPHHDNLLNSIPECNSWYEVNQIAGEVSLASDGSIDGGSTHQRVRFGKLKKNFSSATISSELKRTSVDCPSRANHVTRNRAFSWPTTVSTAPRFRA
ncbi:hypothetical protein B0H34DRAFT_679497 [Crassisporium funariophilum]|nr:hypothetical protein B0H34DRAFT_679497 [Crassisporium funariophilum]